MLLVLVNVAAVVADMMAVKVAVAVADAQVVRIAASRVVQVERVQLFWSLCCYGRRESAPARVHKITQRHRPTMPAETNERRRTTERTQIEIWLGSTKFNRSLTRPPRLLLLLQQLGNLGIFFQQRRRQGLMPSLLLLEYLYPQTRQIQRIIVSHDVAHICCCCCFFFGCFQFDGLLFLLFIYFRIRQDGRIIIEMKTRKFTENKRRKNRGRLDCIFKQSSSHEFLG